MLRRVQKVRQSKALTTSTVYEAGDGKGSENVVPCEGANQLILHIFVDEPGSLTDYTFMVEFGDGSDEGYRETTESVSAGTDTRRKIEFNLAAGSIAGDTRLSIVTPVRGRVARVSVKSTFGGTAPVCAITAATATTLGGEGQVKGPYPVRRARATVALSVAEYGDGRGAENPCYIHWADRIMLHIDAKLSSTSQLVLIAETTVDGIDYYRQTSQEGINPVNVYLKSYLMDYLTFGTAADTDGRAAVALDLLGAWARFAFYSGTALATNVACHALVGRV